MDKYSIIIIIIIIITIIIIIATENKKRRLHVTSEYLLQSQWVPVLSPLLFTSATVRIPVLNAAKSNKNLSI